MGFLAADGCVIRSKNKVTGFSVILADRDKDYLELIKKSIKYTGNLGSRPAIKGAQPQSVLQVYRQKMAEDLIKLGLSPKKSLTLKFPDETQVARQYIHSFVRGFFEGDGCIWLNRRTKTLTGSIAICVTKEFGESLMSMLEEENIKGSLILRQKQKNKNINAYIFQIGGNKQILSFLRWIYRDIVFCMQRKYQKFLELQSVYDLNGNICPIAEKPNFYGKKLRSYLMSPSKMIYDVIGLRQFAKEFGLHKSHIFEMLSDKQKSHKGWTKPDSHQLEIARAANQIIERFY